MNFKQILRNKYFKYPIIIIIALIIVFTILYNYVYFSSKRFIYNELEQVPQCYTALILGAKVHRDGAPSNFLADRLEMGIKAYKSGKIKRFLLSGDHGTKNYDEVNNMKKYLLEKGIDTNDIFLDHAGFDTFNSIKRAKEIFEVKDVIIVSQEFHLPRALYIARYCGLNAYGISADKQNYGSVMFKLKLRERFALIKAFFETIFDMEPKFLGEKIPITGNSRLSYD